MKYNYLILLLGVFLTACRLISPPVPAQNSESAKLALKVKATTVKPTKNNGIYQGDKSDLHVYLLIGQSNMAGRAPLLPEQKGMIENSYLLDTHGVWQVATNPVNQYSTIRKKLGMQKLSLGYSFAQEMSKALQRKHSVAKIGLVVNAKGGTSIKEWQRGSAFYKAALKRAKQAEKTGTLKGIVWHQGETDAENSNYLPQLAQLIANLRADLNAPNLPFVAGQINKVPLINNQIAKLPSTVSNTAFVSSQGLTAMDRWHFDNPSALKLGQRYAAMMLELQQTLK